MRAGGTRTDGGGPVSERAGSPGLGVRVVLAAIAGYRLVMSPWLGPACRFEPSCSRYAAEAVARHGVVRGVWLAARRVGRCHPLGGFGYDPVP